VFFPLVVDSHMWALFDELVCLPFIWGGTKLESILSALEQIYEAMYPLRMQGS
jgi:hypothetical protein